MRSLIMRSLRSLILLALSLWITGCSPTVDSFGCNPYEFPPYRGFPIYSGSRFMAVP